MGKKKKNKKQEVKQSNKVAAWTLTWAIAFIVGAATSIAGIITRQQIWIYPALVAFMMFCLTWFKAAVAEQDDKMEQFGNYIAWANSDLHRTTNEIYRHVSFSSRTLKDLIEEEAPPEPTGIDWSVFKAAPVIEEPETNFEPPEIFPELEKALPKVRSPRKRRKNPDEDLLTSDPPPRPAGPPPPIFSAAPRDRSSADPMNPAGMIYRNR